MDEVEYNTKKGKLFQYFDTAGIDKEEAEKFLKDEYDVSIKIGMSEMDSKARSLVSTMNYYRKYLDKIGNRAKFICLGVTQATDYGLSKKVRDIRSRYTMSSEHLKQQMVEEKLVNKNGVPLHGKNTTIFQEKWGYPIVIDEETSQMLVGVIEDTETSVRYPALIRLYGKEVCNQEKPMYTWGWITGEQTKSDKHPGYIMVTTRDPMFKIQSGQTRIDFDTYESYMNQYFSNIIKDVSTEDISDLADTKGHIFIKNATFLSMDKNSFGWETCLIKKDDQLEVKPEVIADVRISNYIPRDFDEKLPETKMYVCAVPRGRKQNGRLILEAIGIYVNNPQDMEKYKIEETFMLSEEDEVKSMVAAQQVPTQSTESHDFMMGLNSKPHY